MVTVRTVGRWLDPRLNEAMSMAPAAYSEDGNDSTGPAKPAPTTCELSVVIPLHNEEDNIEPLYAELTEVLTAAGLDYEAIFVDDGSRDCTLERLRGATRTDPRVRIIELRRNYGQTAAMAAGFNHARGAVVIPMDGDRQNDPHDIPKLLRKLNHRRGYDVVSGWRRRRQDTFINRRLPSMIANWLIGKVTGVRLHDYGCTLKAYRREILRGVHLYSEMHRFLPALAAWNGARVTEKIVHHRPRTHGQTKYGISRTIRVVFDLITVKFLYGYMTKPLYLFGKMALYAFLAGLAVLVLAIGQKYGLIGGESVHLNRNVLVPLSGLFVILSAQCAVVGVLAELLVRIYHESQNRPIYQIRRIHAATPPPGEAGPSHK